MDQMTQRLLSAMAVMLLVVLLRPGPAAAATVTNIDVLDRSQTVATNNFALFGGSTRAGQIFTAGIHGLLDRVSVYVENFNPGPSSSPITISIKTVVDGMPSETQIGYGSIAANAVPPAGSARWVDATIATSMPVTPGTQYALVLSSDGGAGRLYLADSGTLYPDGDMVYDDGGWVTYPFDAAFKTYVIPGMLDQRQLLSSLSRTLTSTPVGQTFTAGVYGVLDEVSVYLWNPSTSPATGPITVTVQTVTSKGVPSGTEIATGTIPLSAIPAGSYSWVTVYLTSVNTKPVVVTPDTKYALLLASSGGQPRWEVENDVYPGGSMVIKSGTGWASDANDATFRTYVVPAILDQQGVEWFDFGWVVPGNPPNGETFTAGRTGYLSQVGVVLGKDWLTHPNSDVTINFYNVIDGRRIEPVIASGTIPLSVLDKVPSEGFGGIWVDAPVTDDLYVTAGNQYAILLTMNEGNILWLGHTIGTGPEEDMSYRTYVLPILEIISDAPWPPLPVVTHCVNGVCPAARGVFTPADLTGRVTGHVQFQERPDGRVHGILSFSDPRDGGITLQGCTTESAACQLTVTTFACTDQRTITVGGTYSLQGGTRSWYALTLSGVRNGQGTVSLRIGAYTYTLTQIGIVDVTCPAGATLGVEAGRR